MDRMNCKHITSTQAYRSTMKMYLPMLCPNGSSFGSANEPAMKKNAR